MDRTPKAAFYGSTTPFNIDTNDNKNGGMWKSTILELLVKGQEGEL